MAFLDTLKKWWGGIVNLATTPIIGDGGAIVNTTPPMVRFVLNETPAEQTRQKEIVIARRFHEGLQDVRLTPRLRQFLRAEEQPFPTCLNFCAKVVTAPASRLVVEGFECETDNETEAANQVALAAAVWDGSRMDAKSAQLFEGRGRDGEAFLMVDYDAENARPRLTPHERYTDPAHGGNGQGCLLFYPNNDTDQKPVLGVKRWCEHARQANGTFKEIPRITVWTDNFIERYAQGASSTAPGWALADLPEPDGSVLPAQEWNTTTGTADGEPLGIPIVHLKTGSMKCGARAAIPIQVSLNKDFIDMAISGDTAAFKIPIAINWIPTQDGDSKSPMLPVEGGTWLWALGEKVDVKFVEPSDGDRFIKAIKLKLELMSEVTSVPVAQLRESGQVRAEGTLQQEQEKFFAMVRDDQKTLAIGLCDALKIARRLYNAFGHGAGSTIPALDTTAPYRVKWAPISTRTNAERQADAEAMVASGFPIETIWADAWGKTPDEIKLMKQQRQEQMAAQGGGATS